ncbi:hypothetical protein LIER_16404 [Lithospermum erythrorhizon]|uniref:Cathepsin propeptide inhibitor domain-containing protein n=1 Tax=Lithospermum erythrorhizon TaxID=34254 RepID=A0AAV3Q8G0_LITER
MALSIKSKLLFAALLLVGVFACQTTSRTLQDESMFALYEQRMARYGHVYEDETEKANRFKILKENVEYIEFINNAGTKTHKVGVNQFADLTNEEFQAI